MIHGGILNAPLVSIVIPAYNEERYLDATVRSVLDQTFKDFELIIVNDSSTDGTWKKMLDWKKVDKRIVLLNNERNLGIAATLNDGVSSAKGKYIMRIDGGDTAEPTKLEEQIRHLESHKDIAILGTWANVVDEEYKKIGELKLPVAYPDVKKKKYIETVTIHPSVVIRKKVFDEIGMYDGNYRAEDYDFFMRAMHAGYKIENLPKFLFNLMERKGGITISKNRIMLKSVLDIKLRYLWGELSVMNVVGTLSTLFRFIFASNLMFRLTSKIRDTYRRLSPN